MRDELRLPKHYNTVWLSGMIAFIMAFVGFPLFSIWFGSFFWMWFPVPSFIWFAIASIWTDKMIPDIMKKEMLLRKIIMGEENV